MPGNRKKTVYINRNNRKKMKKSKKVTEEIIQKALKDLEKGSSFRTVSLEYSVPVSTLHRRKTTPVLMKKEPLAVLSDEEKKKIVLWITHRAKIGCPATKIELSDNIEVFLEHNNRQNSFKNNKPGRAWFEGFKRRHPEITIRATQSF